MSTDDNRTPTYSPAVHAAARAWADTMPSHTGGFDAMAQHRQDQLLMRMEQSIRAASIFIARSAENESNRALTKHQAEAAELYPMPLDGDATVNACAYAARHAHIAALAARDAEPTTVSADDHEKALRLLRYLTDPGPCHFDHHGGCQAHGFLEPEPGEECPHAEAKRLLPDNEVAGE